MDSSDRDLAAPAGPDESEAEQTGGARGWHWLRDRYFAIDARTLGLTRIFLGFYLIFDLFRRTPDWLSMLSNRGVLPAHHILWRPQADNWSLFHAFTSAGELWLLWALGLLIFGCLLLGYRTRTAQIAAAIYVASMNGRVLLIENGGYVVQNLLLLWTAFLPLGRRFSVDALMASMRAQGQLNERGLSDRTLDTAPFRSAAHVSLAVAAIYAQLFVIYFFNVVHKTGPSWHDGTAVHYVLYVDRMANPLIAATREHIPGFVLIALGKLTMGLEALVPVCMIVPFPRLWAHRLALVAIVLLHLAFGTAFVLGPFAWALCVFATLLISREDWELLHDGMRRESRACSLRYAARSGGQIWLCGLLKLLDRLTLLRFEAKEAGPLEVIKGGRELGGMRALAELTAALPLGPLVAPLLRFGPVVVVGDALGRLAGGERVERFLGLSYRETAEEGMPLSPEGAMASGAALAWHAAGRGLRESLVALFVVAALSQGFAELWVAQQLGVPQPKVLRALTHKLRHLQGWFMFSPNPLEMDGVIVVDALTVDGTRIDPLSGKPPNFELGSVRSFRHNQIWSDYHNRIRLPRNRAHLRPFAAYLRRYGERTGRASDTIVSGTIYWVHDHSPAWGETASQHQTIEELARF